jgi:tetratricopeptide (TPR) repeat protein
MLDFDALEKRCKRYHRKKILKLVSGVIAGIGVLGILVYTYLSQSLHVSNNVTEKKEVVHVVSKTTKPPKVAQETQQRTIKNLQQNKDNVQPTKQLHKKVVTHKEKPKKIIQKKPVKKVEPKSLVSQNEVNIEQLEKVYERRKSYTIAIKIAKKYFDKKDYKNSLKWAKKANNLNKEKSDSWILYAKSKYELGHKSAAKEILHFYLNYKNSKEVKMLLKQWDKK